MPQSRSLNGAVLGVLIGFFVISWAVCEVRWWSINSPDGRFSNVTEYLNHGRTPARVVRVDLDDQSYVVAFSPQDSLLAFPSGPAAYVFDERGQLVDWCSDTGENPVFQRQWLSAAIETSFDELTRRSMIPATVPQE